MSGVLLPVLSDLPGPPSGPSIRGSGPSFPSPLFPTSSAGSDCDSEHIGNRKYHRAYRRKAGRQGKRSIGRRSGIVRGKGGCGRSRASVKRVMAVRGTVVFMLGRAMGQE